MAMEIIYQQESLDDVLSDFAKRYKFPKGSALSSSEGFVDTSKRVVVFKMFVESPDESKT